MRPIELMVLHPSEDLGKVAAEYQDALPRGLAFLTRGLGSHESSSADLLSLLLFHPDYLRRLMAIGERDAEAAHEGLAKVLGVSPAPAPTPLPALEAAERPVEPAGPAATAPAAS